MTSRVRPDPPDPRIGSVVGGRFRVVAELYPTEAFERFTSVDQREGEEVVVEYATARDGPLVEKLLAGVREAARIDHPAVLPVLGCGVDDEGRGWFAHALPPGQSLAAFFERDGMFHELDLCRVFVPVCDALAAIHDVGLVHADLTPWCVYWGDAVVVGGAGSARAMQEPGAAIGRAEFMPPEWFVAGEVDEAGDVYRVGACLYVGATGAPPFSGQTAIHTASLIVVEEAVPVRVRRPLLSTEFAALVHAMLEKDPARRPSLSAVRAALAQGS